MEIDEEKAKECKVVFELFDEDHDGLISKDKLPDVMRALGAAPSFEDVSIYMKKIRGPNFDFKSFMNFFTDKYCNQDTEEDLIAEMSKLDNKGEGTIPRAELIDLMKNYENPLSKDQIDEVLKMADPEETGEIDIEHFIKGLMGKL
ncbi:MAG: hypothetical protein MJ252_02880 [archaeon]|nr:hypothetical protein [archaeon]